MSSNSNGNSERSATALLWLVFAAIVMYLVAAPTLPGSSEITSYRMLCVATTRSGCDLGNSIYTSATFRPDVQTNSVTYWFGDGSPGTMKNCSIRDKKNWACVNELDVGAKMHDGELSWESSLPMTSIPKWKWLLYKYFGASR
jgi:hypothetical protein